MAIDLILNELNAEIDRLRAENAALKKSLDELYKEDAEVKDANAKLREALESLITTWKGLTPESHIFCKCRQCSAIYKAFVKVPPL